jgi:protein-L-isoaspartate O-methyltransferase
MAEIVGDQRLVLTVDVLDDVVAQTRWMLARAGYPGIAVLLRDGVEGAPERAPFDRIVATVGCSGPVAQVGRAARRRGRAAGAGGIPGRASRPTGRFLELIWLEEP